MAIIRNRYTDYDSEYINVADYFVNFKDVFLMEHIYKLMREWFVEEGYTSGKDSEFPEVFFLEKEGQAGKEMWIRWRFSKFPAAGVFWRFDFDVDVHVLTMTKTEIVLGDKKVKADNGEVEIQVKANLVMDWAKRIKKSPLFRAFKEPIKRIFLLKTQKRLEAELYRESYAFRDAVNNFFKIENFEVRKGGLEFWPKKLPE
jgi:hypothetical protein